MTTSIAPHDIPRPDACVLDAMLMRRARETPDKIYAEFEDGTRWTFAELLQQVRTTASGLQALGVRRGDHVNLWMPTSPDLIRVWMAVNWLGAVCVPINLGYRGGVLQHVLKNGGARLIIVDAALLPRLAEVDHASLADAVVFGSVGDIPPGLTCHDAGVLTCSEAAEPARADPWDTWAVIYTSGTTGPSKGVPVSYVHLYTSGEDAMGYLTADDRFLLNLPTFHISGAGAMMLPLLKGLSIVVVESFSTRDYWPLINRYGITSGTLLGAMAAFLIKQPPSPADRGHSLRTVMMAPLPEDVAGFSQRFGVDIYTAYNMSEISSPIIAGPNPAAPGSCGRVRTGVEVRIVDENDIEVPVGEVGELVVRSDRPWSISTGYLNNPEASLRAWRNGWFHTGDALRRDENGDFYFIDRLKDAIRRRGENISSFEVEAEVRAHPSVKDVAVVGVPSEFSEDEVLAVVQPVDAGAVDPAELIAFLIPRMPRFMVPRYVRVMAELPKTPTQKVMKHELRAEGVTADTFDREAAGIVIARDTPKRDTPKPDPEHT